MRCFIAVLLCLVLLMMTANVYADPARFLKEDNNSSFHAEHLRLHINSKNCRASGNYIKIRTKPASEKLVGHLEMADTFTVDEISDHWAKITVVRTSKYSRDSHDGLTGWIDADYIECPCSYEEYYANAPKYTYSLAVTTQKNTNIRELPSKTSTVFTKLKHGEQVEVISEYTGKDKKTWYRVRSSSGATGFVRSDFLEITETGISEDIPGRKPTDSPTPYSETQFMSEPITSEPITPEPVTPEPITPEPITPEPITPGTITEAPLTETPPTEILQTDVPVTHEDSTEEPLPENIMMIEPDQTLPSTDEADDDKAGLTTGEGDPELNSLSLEDESMGSVLTNTQHYLCFTIEPETASASPILLYQWDTEVLIGTMNDDGINGDEISGDGIYSLAFYVNGSDWGKAQYIAIQDDFWSNDVIIHFYNPDMDLNGNFITTLQEAQKAITPVNIETATQFVKDQFLQGNISEYSIEGNIVWYREIHTGYPLVLDLEYEMGNEFEDNQDDGSIGFLDAMNHAG